MKEKDNLNSDDKRTNKRKIIKYIHDDDWDELLKLIKSKEITYLNVIIENGNNIFHIACIKGKDNIITSLINLSKKKEIDLNINLPNKDGLPGLHLYYKFGGNNKSFLQNDDVCYLDSLNNSMAEYLMEKIELLEIFIDNMIKFECIEHLTYNIKSSNTRYYNVLYGICDMINAPNGNNDIKNEKQRYLKLLKILINIFNDRSVAFYAIYIDSIDVIDMLIDMGFNFMIRNQMKNIPLMMAVDFSRYEIIEKILKYTSKKKIAIYSHSISRVNDKNNVQSSNDYEVYMMINLPGKYNNDRAIEIAIDKGNFKVLTLFIQYMKPYIEKYEKERNQTFYFNEIDKYYNTYLHMLLSSEDINTVPIDIFAFFVKHTDLNAENYAGNTPIHMIFHTGIWKRIIDVLQGLRMNMLKLDQYNKNVYSYIEDEDRELFMKLSKTVKLPIENKNEQEIKEFFNLQEMINTEETKKNPKSFGLFNSNMMHYMLYLKYIMDKHPNIYVPVMNYDESKQETDIFFNQLLAYNISDKQYLLNMNVKSFLSIFYSYLPHNIYWIDKDQYYINPNLIEILKDHNKNVSVTDQRYVMIKISQIIDESLLHANALIYDRKKKEAWRFEPYGITDLSDGYEMDKIMYDYLESVYGKITYYDPDSFLQGVNFQLVDGEELASNQNLGDPGGYCLAWSLWFIDVVVTHSDRDIEWLMKNYFTRERVSQILSEEENDVQIKSTNYYLDFIRRYAHMLNRKKNGILRKIGVSQYSAYNIYMDDQMKDLISDLFKVKQ